MKTSTSDLMLIPNPERNRPAHSTQKLGGRMCPSSFFICASKALR